MSLWGFVPHIGNLIREVRSNGMNTRYEYDRVGRRTAIIWPDDYTARYVYNARGDLIRVEEDANGDGTSETTLAEYVYDRLGRMIEQHLGGRDPHGDLTGPGTANAATGVAYAYEADGDLNSEFHLFTSSGHSVTFTYDYDGSGRLTAEHADTGGWLWTAPNGLSWDFYSANAVRTGEPTDVQNRYGGVSRTQGGGTPVNLNFAYDESDNLVADGTRTFLHDTRNRLYAVTGFGDTAVMQYDAVGRRFWYTPDYGTTWQGYFHAGDLEIGQIDGSNRLLHRFIPGPGTDQRVAMISYNTSGNETGRYFYHANRLGSVIAMADASGALADRYVYTPFGVEEPLVTTGNPFRYTGQRYDQATGLYFYRARYYWPQIGRFLETDPIGYADQLNLYAYVGNNPLNATDPSGMQTWRARTEANPDCGSECLNRLDQADGIRESLSLAIAQGRVRDGVLRRYGDHIGAYDAAITGINDAATSFALYGDAGGLNQHFGTIASVIGRDAEVNITAAAVAMGGLPTALNRGESFAQRSFSPRFSPGGIRQYSRLAGTPIRTVNDLSAALRSGRINPNDIPIDAVTRNGTTYLLNTRTANALQRAGFARATWRVRDRTGEPFYEDSLSRQLSRPRNRIEPGERVRSARENR